MTKHSTKRGRITTVIIAVVLVAMLAFIVWIVSLFSVQTHWKDDLAGLTASIAAAEEQPCSLSRGGETVEAGSAELDYFETFLTMPLTRATGYAGKGEGDIFLILPDVTVSFAPAPDGVSTCVRWEKDGRSYGYVLGGTMDYVHLERYFRNAVNNAARLANE